MLALDEWTPHFLKAPEPSPERCRPARTGSGEEEGCGRRCFCQVWQPFWGRCVPVLRAQTWTTQLHLFAEAYI